MNPEQLLITIRRERRLWQSAEDSLTYLLAMHHVGVTTDLEFARQLELLETAVTQLLTGDKAGAKAAVQDARRAAKLMRDRTENSP